MTVPPKEVGPNETVAVRAEEPNEVATADPSPPEAILKLWSEVAFGIDKKSTGKLYNQVLLFFFILKLLTISIYSCLEKCSGFSHACKNIYALFHRGTIIYPRLHEKSTSNSTRTNSTKDWRDGKRLRTRKSATRT